MHAAFWPDPSPSWHGDGDGGGRDEGGGWPPPPSEGGVDNADGCFHSDDDAADDTPTPPSDAAPPPALAALEDLFTGLLHSLAAGAVPDLEVASTAARNVAAAGGTAAAPLTLGTGSTTLSLTGRGGRGAGRYARALLAAAASHEALAGGRTLTQRDLFYSFKSVGVRGATPSAASAAVADVQALLRVPRCALGVVAAPRGSVGGQLWLGSPGGGGDGQWACLADEGPAGRPLPGDTAALLAPPARTDAAHLLIIEKDAVFRRLCEDRVWDRLPGGAVLLTSAGWPALAVRAFAAHLRSTNPASLGTVLGVCDWNPAGVGILVAYKYGTRRGALGGEAGSGGGGGGGDGEGGGASSVGPSDAAALPSLGWLGLRSPHLAGAPGEAFQPLTQRDASLAAGLASGALAGHAGWVAELDAMVGAGLKAELEAVDAVAGRLGSLTDVLVADVLAGAWVA